MNTVDIFCGCGGLSYGFAKEGFKIVKAFDNWQAAINVYNENFLHGATNVDAYALSVEEVAELVPDVIIGGPPCQDYSSAGKRDEGLGRADLTRRFADIVAAVGPRWFVMENVDRIVKSKTLPIVIDIFRNKGYGLTQVVLDASFCGVPQKRKRFFLIGELGACDNFLLQRLTSLQQSKRMSIFDYLGNEFATEFYYRHPRSYARRGIFSVYEPSPTIRGVNRPIPPHYKVHPGDATDNLSVVRVLTTRERARIQTFPKSFRFFGKKTDLEQMIGNAVPVELASFVARALKQHILDQKGEVTIDEQIGSQVKLRSDEIDIFAKI